MESTSELDLDKSALDLSGSKRWREEFIKVIKQTTERVNKQLSTIEKIRKFLLIDKEFTIENEMMTPTLKVRRFMVKLNYTNELEGLY